MSEEKIDLRGMLDLEYEIKVKGFKSSEGDGRTAADIEREREEAKHGTE